MEPTDRLEFLGRFPTLLRDTYLASCSLGAASIDVHAAMGRMLAAAVDYSTAWEVFMEQAAEAKRRFAALIGAAEEQIALVPNASTGAYQVAATRAWSASRPVIVTSPVEFPSIAHVWLAQRRRGADVIYARVETEFPLSAEDHVAAYSAMIDGRTGLVSVPLVTYRDGVRLPVRQIAAVAHAVGARVFVDAYQAAGVEPVNVDALDCDFLVAGTSKYLLGLPGVAFLYVRSGTEWDPPPELTGWFGRVSPFSFDPFTLDYPPDARRYETGTPPIPSLYAANAGLRLIGSLDLNAVRRHVVRLTSHTAELLAAGGFRIRGPWDGEGRGAHVAVVHPDPESLARRLAARRIFVSPRGDVVRIAFHYYNEMADVTKVYEAIMKDGLL